ncbi:PH domain-containing protein [Microvirga tunisiensis]|uniref:PH domain-containing protein n=1 Tax=Pannonibacter tanglangensis TaxID=2750084 RepID=A0A7X5EZ10_9HYPH|nr:PH domain-containing protein [Pannonibacter sp. XCT-53]
MKQFVAREHEIEPVPGLPGYLPAGEVQLWQGRPSARLFARHVLKNRWIAAYFAVLIAWGVASGLYDGRPVAGILFSVAVLSTLAALVLGLIEIYAFAVERTTLYTITSRRVVIRFGVAFSMSLNLPYAQVNAVALGGLGGRAGHVALALKPGHRLSWLIQWPHVRGFRLAEPEPSLICLPDARQVAGVLALAITQHAAATSGHARVTPETATPAAVPGAMAAAE